MDDSYGIGIHTDLYRIEPSSNLSPLNTILKQPQTISHNFHYSKTSKQGRIFGSTIGHCEFTHQVCEFFFTHAEPKVSLSKDNFNSRHGEKESSKA